MIYSHIVAMSENRVIGRDGKLPWHIPKDLKRFKQRTMGHSIIMGRKTFESIGEKALPGRENIVISRQVNLEAAKDGHVVLLPSLDEALKYCKESQNSWNKEEVFIIGGGETYKQSIGMVERIYLTLVHENIDGDTYYPVIDLKEFNEIEKEDFVSGDKSVSVITYRRVWQEKDAGRGFDISLDQSQQNKRMYTRYRIKTRISLIVNSIGSKIHYEFETANLSSGGLFVSTRGEYHPFNTQSIIEICLFTGQNSNEQVSFMGKVAHVQEKGFGVKICEIEQEDQNILNSFIQKNREDEPIG